jgi:hypothetical protein
MPRLKSWFASLKKEWIYRKKYSPEQEFKTLVFYYIEVCKKSVLEIWVIPDDNQ